MRPRLVLPRSDWELCVGVYQPRLRGSDGALCKKTVLFFECFPYYVCPEPVLAK